MKRSVLFSLFAVFFFFSFAFAADDFKSGGEVKIGVQQYTTRSHPDLVGEGSIFLDKQWGRFRVFLEPEFYYDTLGLSSWNPNNWGAMETKRSRATFGEAYLSADLPWEFQVGAGLFRDESYGVVPEVTPMDKGLYDARFPLDLLDNPQPLGEFGMWVSKRFGDFKFRYSVTKNPQSKIPYGDDNPYNPDGLPVSSPHGGSGANHHFQTEYMASWWRATLEYRDGCSPQFYNYHFNGVSERRPDFSKERYLGSSVKADFWGFTTGLGLAVAHQNEVGDFSFVEAGIEKKIPRVKIFGLDQFDLTLSFSGIGQKVLEDQRRGEELRSVKEESYGRFFENSLSPKISAQWEKWNVGTSGYQNAHGSLLVFATGRDLRDLTGQNMEITAKYFMDNGFFSRLNNPNVVLIELAWKF
jgi:hypothetical protein